jgi:predicted phage tail protein
MALMAFASVALVPMAQAGEINDSGASETLGMGVLSAVAAPVLITAGAVGLAGEAGASAANTASDLTGAALDTTSNVVQVGADSAVMTAVGASMATGAVIMLVDESGHGLRELTIDALDESAATMLSDTRPVPRISADINGQRKEIPLVVRPNYVQMNQKVESK